ncbi:MAG: JAB domain-containing protein [Cryomorphaceae bacterium]|nr:MAG: JAB domain-containing protein [Cryomorphaceae bacterium]
MHTVKDVSKLAIKQWAEDDRPREKLLYKGASALSDAELIAILIGSGNRKESAVELSQRILKESGQSFSALARLTLHDLMNYPGIGEAKAISIAAALEVGRRRKAESPTERLKITQSSQVYEEMFHLADINHEEFWVMLLDRANQVIEKVRVSSGGVAGTVADARIIYKSAIQRYASSIILVHNHPSGNLRPSEQDIRLTKKLKAAGEVLEIPVLDHIIVTHRGYYSFMDEGNL